jgi:hypothetical protein
MMLVNIDTNKSFCFHAHILFSTKKIRNIRRQNCKKYSAEEKIRIVLEGLRGDESIAEELGGHPKTVSRALKRESAPHIEPENGMKDHQNGRLNYPHPTFPHFGTGSSPKAFQSSITTAISAGKSRKTLTPSLRTQGGPSKTKTNRS